MQNDLDLMAAVNKWREECALEKLGPIHYDMYGPSFFFPYTQIQHLVDCAYAGKITDMESLAREIQWNRKFRQEYGPSLLAVIEAHRPPSAPIQPPEALESPANVIDGNSMSHRGDPFVTEPQRMCKQCSDGACGVTGHTSSESFG